MLLTKFLFTVYCPMFVLTKLCVLVVEPNCKYSQFYNINYIADVAYQ